MRTLRGWRCAADHRSRVIALLAHQGGWDEILLVLGPIMIIVGLLRLAKHRVERDDDRTN